MKKEIYIDANIFIQAVVRNDKSCILVLEKIIKGEFIGFTSVLSWDELVHIVRKFIGKDIAMTEGKKFLQFPNLIFVDAKKEIIIKAQKLTEKYNLRPRDAIHVATAMYSNTASIISEDGDFDKVKELKRIVPKEI